MNLGPLFPTPACWALGLVCTEQKGSRAEKALPATPGRHRLLPLPVPGKVHRNLREAPLVNQEPDPKSQALREVSFSLSFTD